MKKTQLAATFAIAIAAVTAYAQSKPEDAIRARQSIMRVVAMNFGPVSAMAQDKIPFNKDAFVENATRLEAVWKMNPGRFFVPGTDKPVAGSKIATFTDARPEAITSPDFKAAYEDNTKAIAKLAAAARSGDEKAMKGAADDVGKACKGCHDEYRLK